MFKKHQKNKYPKTEFGERNEHAHGANKNTHNSYTSKSNPIYKTMKYITQTYRKTDEKNK